MNNYKYTVCWFTVADMDKYISRNIDISKQIDILEIGSYEGRSSVWFLENIIKNNKSSTLTCIDPWLDYSQNKNAFDSYSKIDSEWKLESSNIKNTFLYNIKETGFENQVIVYDGQSKDILPKLNDKRYDIIFIDGNHAAPFVLTDAVMSWFLLKEDGLMIFDDYGWVNPKANFKDNNRTKLEPKIAIDSFVSVFENYIEVIYSGYRKAIKKKKSS